MKHLKRFDESIFDWFKDDPSKDQKELQDAIDKVLKPSLIQYFKENPGMDHSNLVGMSNKLSKDLISELAGKTYISGKRDREYDFVKCSEIVDDWLKKNAPKTYNKLHLQHLSNEFDSLFIDRYKSKQKRKETISRIPL